MNIELDRASMAVLERLAAENNTTPQELAERAIFALINGASGGGWEGQVLEIIGIKSLNR